MGIIFLTVFMDLIGFGMIIPLVGIYGRHYGASTLELTLLGSIYSIMQFFFSPIWGRLSDQHGRRPILLLSLLGSTLSYFGFAFSNSIFTLILTRALAGVFAANISTAQAYIADITTEKDRAKGMGLIGAAFGIGFTLGPPIGGIAAAKIGLMAPGLIAGSICLINLVFAWFRLNESLSLENRTKARSQVRASRFAQLATLKRVLPTPRLAIPLIAVLISTFAFSNLEQVFSLLIQSRFSLATEEAGYRTGLILMWSGILGALIQGGLIRKLVPRFGEYALAGVGFFTQGLAMVLFVHSPSYESFFLSAIPLAIGSSLINPTLSSMISKNTPSHEQGSVMGLKESLGSLARIFGPISGLLAFSLQAELPFYIGAGSVLIFGLFWISKNSMLSPQPHQ